MPDVRITCISKQPRDDTDERTTHLGSSTTWKWTRNQVVASIEAKTNTFYTLKGGNRAEIGVVNGPNGKSVRTYVDGQWNNNLLSLPERPWRVTPGATSRPVRFSALAGGFPPRQWNRVVPAV